MNRMLMVGLFAVAFIAWSAVGQAQVINELRYDDDLGDDMEFLEIKGDPGLNLDGYSLVDRLFLPVHPDARVPDDGRPLVE